MRRVMIQALATLFFVASLGAAPVSSNKRPDSKNVPHKATVKPYQVGRASWYGKKFDGKETASGETYDMFRFTAAHRTLPLGSLVRVTNLRNGKWVLVRINDRGPVVPGRILDLSYGAAQMLSMTGVGRVRLDLVSEEQQAIVARNFAGK